MSIERLLEASRAFDRGDLDAAERVYLAVAEADPRSTIALVGLARVAMARGTDADLAQAERLATTVLAHDPENAAARRLLDEWRARTGTSGDPVTPPQAATGDDRPASASGSASGSASPEDSGSASPEASGSASPEASGSASPEALGSPGAPAVPAGGSTGIGTGGEPDDAGDEAPEDDEYPWPDLDEQLARYREHQPGRLGRLFRRKKG